MPSKKNKPKIIKPKLNLPKVSQQIKETFAFLWQNKKIFGVISLVYIVVSYLFTGGITQNTFLQVKEAANALLANQSDSLGVSAVVLISTVSRENGDTQLYSFIGFFTFIVFWLTIIWAIRMIWGAHIIKIRDALYGATGPLIPTLIVCLYISLQLLPAAIGFYIILISQTGLWAQNVIEVAVTSGIGVLLVATSLYLLIASSMSLIIVTIPQTYPWAAIRLGQKLVKGRRLSVLSRIFVLAVILFVVWVVFLSAALLIAYYSQIDWLPLVPIVFQLLKAFTILFSATYIYKLYRSLL